ncbi:hypothetical protein I5L01_15615, partial [Erythrobacter sp. YJ-T3-07]|uniref:hypothetical protein n=1 Tax=Erythrobacter sp. YJ-T3-07 TaxID=2793063 RepID=UPI0018D49280
DEIKDLVEDYEDVKWIYQALLEYSTAFEALKPTAGANADDPLLGTESKAWLAKLRELDPLRNGRWNDVQPTT